MIDETSCINSLPRLDDTKSIEQEEEEEEEGKGSRRRSLSGESIFIWER